MNHHEVIIDQFTRQAAPYTSASPVRNQELLDRIVGMADPQAEDTVLDAAWVRGLRLRANRAARDCIDLTPAMLDQAHRIQAERGLGNLTWDQGGVSSLPYRNGQFTIVLTRFSFHHFPQPLTVLKEMRRVGRPGGRVIVADSAPAAKAEAFNAMERLRDPSHVRALPSKSSSLSLPRLGCASRPPATIGSKHAWTICSRSFPAAEGPGGGKDRLWKIFEDSLADDALDMKTRRDNGQIFYAFPIAIVAATIP